MRSIGHLEDFSDISPLGIKEIHQVAEPKLASCPIYKPGKLTWGNNGQGKRNAPEIINKAKTSRRLDILTINFLDRRN
jgi:hypothetical protein